MRTASMLTTSQVIRDGLSYLFRGGFRIKNGHLPTPNHTVPDDFFGVCVASNENAETDTYVIEQLNELGIKNVRLDFSYGDLGNFTERFLRALIAAEFKITLHLLPPFESAKNMKNASEKARWGAFLQAVLTQYGAQIAQVEIGNTLNRKRWAGFDLQGFFTAWEIAHAEVKSRGIKLLGPNIQDFEPFYNVSILKQLREQNQLPDTQTDNLFAERMSEPERYDFRIFKYRWAEFFKYNLIKKARLLQKIGQDFNVTETSSSAAFWAIYRIERILENGTHKQADYLTRYFTLLAASGALRQANWGALICHREGLIDDGLQDAEYPDLERIAHYKSADGDLKNYARYPSFAAMRTAVKWLSGAHYVGKISRDNGLEIHHFQQHDKQFHVAWTVNGKVAFLADLYQATTLGGAQILASSGMPVNRNIGLITETPTYIIWEKRFHIEIKSPKLAKDLAIHAHVQNLQYFRFNENDWQGLILAKDATEAALLAKNLHPERLQSPQKNAALRHARNAIWTVADPRDNTRQLTIKQPIKMYPHKAFLDRFKPSKAKRSWNGAMELMRRDIATARPVAYFEKVGDTTCKQNFYICDFVESDCTIGQIFSAFAQGETTYLGLQAEEIYLQFAQFCNNMHGRLIYFRDFSGGNILVKLGADKKLQFSLIDTARLKSVLMPPFPVRYRIADLTRACHKLDWAGRKRFMQIYLGITSRQFTWQNRLQFHLYDFKVWLKRTIGRKGIKRLIKRFKKTNST